MSCEGTELYGPSGMDIFMQHDDAVTELSGSFFLGTGLLKYLTETLLTERAPGSHQPFHLVYQYEYINIHCVE
jgi:hypothetical protein